MNPRTHSRPWLEAAKKTLQFSRAEYEDLTYRGLRRLLEIQHPATAADGIIQRWVKNWEGRAAAAIESKILEVLVFGVSRRMGL